MKDGAKHREITQKSEYVQNSSSQHPISNICKQAARILSPGKIYDDSFLKKLGILGEDDISKFVDG